MQEHPSFVCLYTSAYSDIHTNSEFLYPVKLKKKKKKK